MRLGVKHPLTTTRLSSSPCHPVTLPSPSWTLLVLSRCHQNDLENVVPFVLVGLLYSLTGPDAATAITYFRVFAASRLCHTVAYVLPLPQPSRALSWLTGLVVTCCMAYRVLLHNFRL